MGQPLDDQIRRLEDIFRSEADPDGRSFVSLAELHRRSGRLDEALRIAKDGTLSHPGMASGHVVVGRIHADMGDGEAARDAFRKVLEVDPRNIEGLRGLSHALLEEGEKEEALELLETLLREDPTDDELPSRVRTLKAKVGPAEGTVESVETAGPFEAAEDAEEAAGRMEALDAPPATEVEEVPVETEPEMEAEPDVMEAGEEAAEAEPEGAVAEAEDDGFFVADDGPAIPGPDTVEPGVVTRTLGRIYLRQGLHERAEAVFEELLEEKPEDEELLRLLKEARSRDREEEAPEAVGVEALAPDEIVPVESLAPDEVVPIESLAPDTAEAAPVQEPVRETVVPIESLAPDEIVPVESLAPDEIVPVEALAPDETPDADSTLDDFQNWLDNL